MSKGITSSGSLRPAADVEVLDWKEIGQRIREIRGFYMRQEEFAKKIGVSQGHLSRIERGEKEIGAQILLNIARVCGKSIEWLLIGKDKSS
jgi:transcriptional regulator with XRE-family HTH domain